MSKKKVNKKYESLCLYYKTKYKYQEEWRQLVIDNFFTDYIVSNYGRIYRVRDDKIELPHMSYINKHYSVSLKINGDSKIIPVYRLVALVYIEVPQKYFDAGYKIDDLVVDHIRDGDKDNFDDNTIWNLQWLTRRENTSKALKCGLRPMYPIEFRPTLDRLIMEGYDNKYIYDYCKKEFNLNKDELKAQVQVRRRRLHMTLNEHHEREKAFTKKVDKLILKGLSNNEIMKKLNITRDSSSIRLMEYRRHMIGRPANVSKYLSNDENIIMNQMIADGATNKEIFEKFDLYSRLSDDEQKRFHSSIATRRSQYKRKISKDNVSSTTIESIT